jgi:AraC-type DNA-binding domain-containing proteins
MGVLLYNAISRDFAGRKEKNGANVKKIIQQGKANSVNMKKEKLSRRLFENIVIKDKVFLHPRLSLVELATLLKTDRNALSAFVNAEYGMNFNRYINSLRLSEFERLQNMPENKNAKSGELAVMSGFGNYHCYLRERKVKEKNEAGIAKVKEKETKRKGTDANN